MEEKSKESLIFERKKTGQSGRIFLRIQDWIEVPELA
jgi:hypothetical protein